MAACHHGLCHPRFPNAADLLFHAKVPAPLVLPSHHKFDVKADRIINMPATQSQVLLVVRQLHFLLLLHGQGKLEQPMKEFNTCTVTNSVPACACTSQTVCKVSTHVCCMRQSKHTVCCTWSFCGLLQIVCSTTTARACRARLHAASNPDAEMLISLPCCCLSQ